MFAEKTPKPIAGAKRLLSIRCAAPETSSPRPSCHFFYLDSFPTGEFPPFVVSPSILPCGVHKNCKMDPDDVVACHEMS